MFCSSCKYRVHLSSESMTCLQRYLSQHGHVILLQVGNMLMVYKLLISRSGLVEENAVEVYKTC